MWNRLNKFLISLRFAVMVILALAVSLAAGTFLESAYDTATAQYWVYRAPWFYGVLSLLGLNILFVALSRLPWKPRHTPFLLAHLGILLLLLGSWLTFRLGLDGMLRIGEGNSESVVEVDSPTLILSSGEKGYVIPVKWVPPNAKFSPHKLPYGLVADQMISRAEPHFSFIPKAGGTPAVRLKLTTARAMGGLPAMAVSQDLWLWAGDPSWGMADAGPAKVFFNQTPPAEQPGPWLALFAEKSGIRFSALSMRGKKSSGRVKGPELSGKTIDPGWKAISLKIEEWIPEAISQTEYVQAKTQYGPQAPPSAIHLTVLGKDGKPTDAMWLGMGDRVVLNTLEGDKPKQVQISYLPKRVILPFSIRLDRFSIERYEGTQNPASFSSLVSLPSSGSGSPTEIQKVVQSQEAAAPSHVISMNEPLEHGGFTFYQSSYEDAQPRPTVSVFSVNRDPGRWWKYIGSILLVSGSILLFVVKYVKAKSAPKVAMASEVSEIVRPLSSPKSAFNSHEASR